MNPVSSIETETKPRCCPSRAELSAWLETEGSSEPEIAKHLEGCPACCLTLENLSSSTVVDSFARTGAARPIGLSFLEPPKRPGDLGMLGPYAIERELGSGGMGIVFQAWDTCLERPVAIKLMRMLDSPAASERFHREARAAANLVHDHIVPIHAVAATRDGRSYLVMPLIEGESLRQRLNRTSLDPREAAEWICQIASGLQVAHDRGMLHRDIKPANILLDRRDQRAKLSDFGLVRIVDDQSIAQTDGILGTPEFMSPEQIRNERLDGRCDVYGLGITLYQALTGVTPFRGPTFEVLRKQQEELPLAPTLLRPDIPRDLETICLKAIRKAPDSRYPTAQALADDLTRFLAGEAILARPVSLLERSRNWIRKHPWQALSAALATVVFLGTAGGALLLAQAYRNQTQTNQALQQSQAEANRAFQLTRDQLTAIVSRLKDDLLQLPQAEQIAIESIREVTGLYAQLNQLRPTDQVVAEEYLQALKEEWYAEWLYDGDTLEQKSLERFQSESIRLLKEFPQSSTIASLRAELLLDLAVEAENAGDREQADRFQLEGQTMLGQLLPEHADSLPVRTLVWKAAWQDYQLACQRQAPTAELVTLARQMVAAQAEVIELTPAIQRTEAVCIGVDQLSRLVEAQVEAGQLTDAAATLEQARTLLASLEDSALQTMEVQSAHVRLLRAELQLAKANRDVDLQGEKIEQLVAANRKLSQDFPEGESQMKALVQALCDQVEFAIAHGQRESARAGLPEIAGLLDRIDANKAMSAWATPLRERFERLQEQLGD
jgi:serine/threonine protein kinase